MFRIAQRHRKLTGSSSIDVGVRYSVSARGVSPPPPPPTQTNPTRLSAAAVSVVPGGTINLAGEQAATERVDPDSVCVGR